MRLGVNIDHIATLREARKINEPDPLEALFVASRAGASGITIHLREDRRHIDDYDAKRVVENSKLPVNIECSISLEIIEKICALKPFRATIVPEKREEVTTEGGLNLDENFEAIGSTIKRLKRAEISTSLFIDPTLEGIKHAKELGVDMVEFHTGKYANIDLMLYSNLSLTKRVIEHLMLPREELALMLEDELALIKNSAISAKKLGLKVAAGHGLNYTNVKRIVEIVEIEELNIGQSIVARAVYDGLYRAIKDMVELLD